MLEMLVSSDSTSTYSLDTAVRAAVTKPLDGNPIACTGPVIGTPSTACRIRCDSSNQRLKLAIWLVLHMQTSHVWKHLTYGLDAVSKEIGLYRKRWVKSGL